MKVLSTPGSKCPKEEDPKTYILDTGDPIEVPDTMYYRRLVSEGSLVHVSEKLSASQSESRNAKSKKEVATDGK